MLCNSSSFTPRSWNETDKQSNEALDKYIEKGHCITNVQYVSLYILTKTITVFFILIELKRRYKELLWDEQLCVLACIVLIFVVLLVMGVQAMHTNLGFYNKTDLTA